MDNKIAIISEESIKEKMYYIRNTYVMLDYDLAKVYGYETKNFNRQVKNNIEKFDEDFMFQLTDKEVKELSRCKNFTTMQIKGIKGGRVYNPYAFTEQGIYMLMTVLKGELATEQSKALVRIFKRMKDYILTNNKLTYDNILNLSLQTNENTKDISNIKKELSKITNKINKKIINEEITILNGKQVESNIIYDSIYKEATKTIFIIDNYVEIKTLILLKNIDKNIKVIVFTDNISKKLHKLDLIDFYKEYPHLNISFKITNKIFHDRYIILDYGTRKEKIYHCGASSKDSGKKITTINKIKDKKIYKDLIIDILNNKELKL